MGKNKYLCPECGTEMITEYDKPAINLSCPKCGSKIATTLWEEIDLDDTTYKIKITAINKPINNQVRVISNMIGKNYIECLNILKVGGELYRGTAYNVLKYKRILDINNIQYLITPEFKYEYKKVDWDDGNCLIHNVLDEIYNDNYKFPSKCPICGKNSCHFYMVRFEDNNDHGGAWIWCSDCYSFSHFQYKIPTWWKNCPKVDFDFLGSPPDYLESKKDEIDNWNNAIFNKNK